jgi:hypothetical protein
MSNELNDIIQEIERLLILPISERKLEGIYADTSQLKFLLKKIKSNKINSPTMNGMAKFVSDFSSSDSKILALIDKLEK